MPEFILQVSALKTSYLTNVHTNECSSHLHSSPIYKQICFYLKVAMAAKYKTENPL